ncbi:MAG: response regulator [Chloroflexi bacterium]|nr:MAG: response regulator [Chloroflexota bacterium]
MQRNVVLIEDDEGIREVIELALTAAGYRVHLASNGAQALDIVAGTSPQLILLDLKMPILDGREFARRYESSTQARAPLVLLTAAQDPAAEAASIGADAYLAKPFDLDALLAMIERMTTQV